ncbi:MAG: LicD family protein [Bacilli bacterium]|nr:LicD family protein [Bacilli bacterium]
MNNIQQKLIEIAKEYIKVCEKLNFRYFAAGGTALGAARHKGFIPWDDDMDFQMPREDYEIFLREGQKLLPSHLFIQTHKTDKKYLTPFAKIRDCNTTAIDKYYSKLKINQGLWIDVVPLDSLPKSHRKIKCINRIDERFLHRRYMPHRYKPLSKKSAIANFLNKILLPSKTLAYKISQHLTLKYTKKNQSDIYWNNCESRVAFNLKKEWFEGYDLLPFEDIQMRVPLNCDTYLTDHYGEWRKLPPDNKRITNHEFSIVDLEKPYTKYFK